MSAFRVNKLSGFAAVGAGKASALSAAYIGVKSEIVRKSIPPHEAAVKAEKAWRDYLEALEAAAQDAAQTALLLPNIFSEIE